MENYPNYPEQPQGYFQDRASYDVDLVLCIDATGSMRPIIDMVKENALRLYDDICQEAKSSAKEITSFRVKIIVFRDYCADGPDAIAETNFMLLPEEKQHFQELVNSIEARGGGDEPEDGLEALAYAIRSDWQPQRPYTKRRQIIAVWTDAPTHKLGFGRSSPYYDPALPSDFSALTDLWGDDEQQEQKSPMNYIAKRLLLFAPMADDWSKIHGSWDNVIMVPSIAGGGLREIDYQHIIRLVVKTL